MGVVYMRPITDKSFFFINYTPHFFRRYHERYIIPQNYNITDTGKRIEHFFVNNSIPSYDFSPAKNTFIGYYLSLIHILLIIALSNHPVLGPLLIPYFAKAVSQDVISVEEQATHAGNDTELSEMEKRVIAIAQSYSEKNLMQVYSRQQTVAGFLSSVTAEMLKKQLRPFIDKKIREMVRFCLLYTSRCV